MELFLPETLRTIGPYAFASCVSLEEVSFPSSLVRIEERAFSNDKLLKNIQFQEGLAYIGDQAFAYTSITRISLPLTISYLGDKLFHRVREIPVSQDLRPDDPSLTLVLGPKLWHIGEDAFSHLEIAAFEVDPENRFFSSRDGQLYDRTGRRLRFIPPLAGQ